MAKRRGRPRTDPLDRVIVMSVGITPRLLELMKARRERNGISFSRMVRCGLWMYLDPDAEKKAALDVDQPLPEEDQGKWERSFDDSYMRKAAQGED